MADTSSDKKDIEPLVLASAFRLALADGWKHVTMSAIAKDADLSLTELRSVLPSKQALPRLLSAEINRQVEADYVPAEPPEPVRERLFDLLMTRFEKLTPYREGLASVTRDGLMDPFFVINQLCAVRSSMVHLMTLTQLSTDGPFGKIRLKGLSFIYVSVFRIWLRDDTKDLSKTMSELDKALDKADRIAKRIPA